MCTSTFDLSEYSVGRGGGERREGVGGWREHWYKEVKMHLYTCTINVYFRDLHNVCLCTCECVCHLPQRLQG